MLRKMRRYNFSYDKENDDLFLFRPGSKSKGSVEIGDLVIDFNSKRELVGLQIMNASKLIKDMVDENLMTVKKLLSNLSDCKVDVNAKGNALVIKFVLMSKFKELAPTLYLPSISEQSPALATA
ncbi:DUF2283 domain-containing protein [Nanoarchaeota archaeon]